MENNFYNDNFEALLKEKSDEFRMYPSKRVWHSIYNDLHPSRKWPSIAISMLLVIALLLIGYLNTSDNVANRNFARYESGQPVNNSNKLPVNIKSNKLNTKNTTQSNVKNVTEDATDDNSTSDLTNTDLGNTTNSVIPGSTADNSLFVSNTDQTDLKNNTNASSKINNPPVGKDKNIVEEMDKYINSNQLVVDVALSNVKKLNRLVTKNSNTVVDELNTEANNGTSVKNISKPAPLIGIPNTKTLSANNDKSLGKPNIATNEKADPNSEKAWIEDFALHNKSSRKKWKDFTEMEFYATPAITYRKLASNVKSQPAAVVTSLTAMPPASPDVNKSVRQRPSIGLEAGFGISYAIAKKVKLKVGVQFNYTNYAINASETNHPVLTTLMLNDLNTGYSYLSPRSTTLSNIPGLQSVTLHNKTYQVAIPVGFAVKLAGKSKVEWYAGGTVQPSFVLSGKANLPSSDYQNYVVDNTLLRKWNMNVAVETYINYKLKGYSLQVGPQLRYQALSTYSKKYTINEKLYNMGLKVGIVKSF